MKSNFFESNLWVEKYRPKNLSQLVLDDHVSYSITQDINKKEMGNYLFYGPPGTGKTTISRIIINNIMEDNDNVLYLNGSSERTIDILRNKITNFLTVDPFGNDRYKVVFIDEADNLTDVFFKALRNFIEKYTEIGRFIFTCNYITRIPKPIQSRFRVYELKPMSDEMIKNLCYNILNNENVQYQKEHVDMIVNIRKPDIRAILQLLQQHVVNNELKLPDINTLIRKEDQLVSLTIETIKAKISKQATFLTLRDKIEKIIMDKNIDYVNVFEKLFISDELPALSKVIINKYVNSLNNVVSYSMHYMACIYEIITMIEDMNK